VHDQVRDTGEQSQRLGAVEISCDNADTRRGKRRIRRPEEGGNVVTLEPLRERAAGHIAAAYNE
jgi:hypothetical protein